MIEIDNFLDFEQEEIDAMRRTLKELTELILSTGHRLDIAGELEGDPDPHDTDVDESLQEDPQ
jgi:hypothetical protein